MLFRTDISEKNEVEKKLAIVQCVLFVLIGWRIYSADIQRYYLGSLLYEDGIAQGSYRDVGELVQSSDPPVVALDEAYFTGGNDVLLLPLQDTSGR